MRPVEIKLDEAWLPLDELWKSKLPTNSQGKMYYASDIVKFIEQDVAPKYGFELILKPNLKPNSTIPVYYFRFNDTERLEKFKQHFGVEE